MKVKAFVFLCIPIALAVTLLGLNGITLPAAAQASASQPCIPVPFGTVSLWDGDVISGATATDVIGQNSGTIFGNVTVVTGRDGSAFHFDGVSSRIEMANPPTLNFDDTKPFSLEAWFLWDGAGSPINNIVRKSNYPVSGPGAGYWLRIVRDSQILQFFVGETVGIPSFPRGAITTPVSPGTWHHVVGTRDASGTITLYLDGQAQATTQAVGAQTTSSAPFTLGAWDDRFGVVELYSGQIEQVSVYNRALDASEVQALFAAGAAGKVPAFKQFTGTDYDQSYVTTTRYATRGSTPVSMTGQMELQNGSRSSVIPLSSAMNNLDSLETLIRAVPGANAVVGGSGPNFYLSVYNTRCEKANCSPRNENLLHLCDGTCAAGSDILEPKLMDDYGCAVTSVAMAASHVGLRKIQEKGGTKPFTPKELNEFMSNTIELTDLGGLFDPQGNVDWFNTPAFLKTNTGIQSLQFDGSISLDDALCKKNLPVIVNVASPHGPHYVVVTGKQGPATDGSQYSINDPGYNKHTLKDYNNSFTKVGVIKDPGDMSEFNVSVGEEADLLVKDVSGRRTGFDTEAGQVTEIPSSAYVRTQVADDITGETSTGLTHSIQVLTPSEGTYSLTVNGVQRSLYTVTVHFYSQDGTAQPELSLSGIANVGSSSTFQIDFLLAPGAVSTFSRFGTFQSTLSDINSSLQLGLIDNEGVGNSLSKKIMAAQDATGSARNNILNAFKNEVNAQSGKHITGIAPQVLIEDANSLINQNAQ